MSRSDDDVIPAAPFRLDGKTAVVTGGASGIGAAVVRTLARQGARVFIGDVNEDNGVATLAGVLREGGKAEYLPLDVSDTDKVKAAFAEVDTKTGGAPLDLLVCCAGIGFVGDVLQTTPADFDRLMTVNARGVFLCLQAAVQRMKQSGRGGSIVNIASIASKVSLSERFAYSATKGAVLMMTKSVAQDFIGDKIRCNCVCPARVHTALVDAYLAKNYAGREAEQMAILAQAQPMGRMGTPDEIANLVLYLCSDEAAFTTGVAYDIDGGSLAVR